MLATILENKFYTTVQQYYLKAIIAILIAHIINRTAPIAIAIFIVSSSLLVIAFPLFLSPKDEIARDQRIFGYRRNLARPAYRRRPPARFFPILRSCGHANFHRPCRGNQSLTANAGRRRQGGQGPWSCGRPPPWRRKSFRESARISQVRHCRRAWRGATMHASRQKSRRSNWSMSPCLFDVRGNAGSPCHGRPRLRPFCHPV